MAENTTIWYNYDLSNAREYTRCIKHLQKMIRQSMSYDAWQRRSKIGINECPICKISKELAKMESHHYPKTLFDVVDDYMQMMIDYNKIDEIKDFEFSQEIMNQHFEGTVNYIVLCEYCHKKYHDDVPEVLDLVDEAWRKQKELRDEYFKKKDDKCTTKTD